MRRWKVTAGAMALAVAAIIAFNTSGRTATVVNDWASVKVPPAPEPKPVTLDPKTTALLMLDFMNQSCGKRPACVASLPAMAKLLADARAAKATVIYSIIANTTTADIMKEVAPLPDEPWVQSGPDKFLNTSLATILKDKGIQTVIVAGTASNGAVLFTGSGAAFRGMNVMLPIDGMSSTDPFADVSTVFTFMTAPSVSAKAVLTRSDLIKF